jgi:hypothetical protein
LISLYFLHVIGLFYTTDFNYALKDLRIKLPLLALPVIFATTKTLEAKKIDLLLLMHMGAVMVASFISFGILLTQDISDIRDVSPFISHIRLSLNVVLAIFFAGYFIFFRYRDSIMHQVVFGVVILWFTGFLFVIESVTGIFTLLGTSLFLLVYGIIKYRNLYLRLTLAMAFLLIPTFFYMIINDAYRAYSTPYKNDLNNLEKFSELGNPYTHDTIHQPVESGSYVGIYVSVEELGNAWSRKSSMPFDSLDEKRNLLKHTLIRYLNSMGLRKDSAGLVKLSSEDIRNVEQGFANVTYTKKLSVKSRLYKIFWEYETLSRGGNPSGHSLLQRLEFWRVSSMIIKKNFWIGVGTGDIPDAFARQYEESNSPLAPEFRHRAHNQYLAIFITFGLVGLIWFLFTLYYPPASLKRYSDFRYFVFIIIISLSMLVEDTLETQMGVTLYAFFNSFFLFVVPRNKS